MSAEPEPPGHDSDATDSGESKSPFFRSRGLLVRGPQWDLPEGELATPAQSAEFRRRRRHLNLVQGLNLFGFIPLAAWIGLRFLDNLPVQILYLAVVAVLAIAFLSSAQRAFRCPSCEETFPVYRQSIYAISPRRREMIYSRFRWCDNCGARFELYPPSAPDPPEDDDGFGIL